MGILGGALVGVGMLDLSPACSTGSETRQRRQPDRFRLVGLFKSAVFGVLVAIAGCMRGIAVRTQRVGGRPAATSAVVTASS